MAKKELFSDVDELVSSLNKELGEGSIMNFGDDKPIISIPRETDTYLVPKGWWEYRHFNQDDVYNKIVDEEVVAWMPLPEPCTDGVIS